MRVQRIGAQHIGDIGEIFRPITCLLCHNSVPCYDLVDSQVRKTSNNNHCGILPVYKIYIIIYKGAKLMGAVGALAPTVFLPRKLYI